MTTRWHLARDPADWLKRALAFVDAAATRALTARGVFHIVLAGGSTPDRLYRALSRRERDWSGWHCWFGDERCLPTRHPERNSRMAREAWLERVAIPAGQIHPIPAELGPAAGAQAYAQALASVRSFDLVLLGLGEDGHTASLFPGRDWGETPHAPAALAIYDAPKPPPERISLSAYRLARARQVLFLVSGAGKQAALAAWRRGENLPAAAIRPETGADVLVDPTAWGETR